MEIEKKYLVKDLPQLGWNQSHEISQGYISLSPEVRIRKKDDKFFITEKSDGTLSREERETEISEIIYEILLDKVKSNIIDKIRFEIPLEEDLTAELDLYRGNLIGLATVEVEFPDEERANSFIPPEWFGKDVTSDKRYKNKNLSQLESASKLLGDDPLTKSKK